MYGMYYANVYPHLHLFTLNYLAMNAKSLATVSTHKEKWSDSTLFPYVISQLESYLTLHIICTYVILIFRSTVQYSSLFLYEYLVGSLMMLSSPTRS